MSGLGPPEEAGGRGGDDRVPSRLAPWAPPHVQRRMAELEADVGSCDPTDVPALVERALQGHAQRIDHDGVVLYGGTNTLTPAVRRVYDAKIGTLPSMGLPGDKYQTGLADVERLEVLAGCLLTRLFGAAHLEVRPPSATMANLAVYRAFAEPGDTIAVLPQRAGGHDSHHAHGAAGARGLRIVELPYDDAHLDVDVEALPGFVDRERPRLVVIGSSLLLFPHRLEAIRAIADRVGALVVYDASHVAGLVAGARFQQPLAEGAHLMTFSTYKSLGGPPGGAVATNDPRLGAAVSAGVYPGLTANYDSGRLPALAVCAAEQLRFGPAYASACADNAAVLAEALRDSGFTVLGRDGRLTASHHVGVDVRALGDGDRVARHLAEARVYLSQIGLPVSDDPAPGIRIGTQVVTRRGMTPEHMPRIARWCAAVLLDGAQPRQVGDEVREFARGFSGMRFCFD